MVITQERVVDHGTVPCAWKRRDVPLADCASCPALADIRNASATATRRIDVVRCTVPLPLV